MRSADGQNGGEQRSIGWRLWMLVRHDFGRKLTALIVAVALWYSLANRLTLDRRIQLQVREVASRAEAEQLRSTAPAVYLVVPPDFIVSNMSRKTIRVDVRGNKDEVRNMELSAILEVELDALGSQDEAVIPLPLVRTLFKVQGGEPSLTEFDVKPPVLDIRLARRREAEITLGPQNVVVVGRPREGYAFDESSIRVAPNRVRISGPISQVESLARNPEQLKLVPIDIEGRILEVSQQVGIDVEKVDRSVALLTTGGLVEVSIPVRPREITKELLSVPVDYRNEDALRMKKRRVVFATETIDLLVTGPRSVLEGLTREELAERILPVFDWSQVTLTLGDEPVRIFRGVGLPDSVRITDSDGRPAEIHYSLESTDSDPRSVTDGEAP
jgi:hypothetical protein